MRATVEQLNMMQMDMHQCLDRVLRAMRGSQRLISTLAALMAH